MLSRDQVLHLTTAVNRLGECERRSWEWIPASRGSFTERPTYFWLRLLRKGSGKKNVIHTWAPQSAWRLQYSNIRTMKKYVQFSYLGFVVGYICTCASLYTYEGQRFTSSIFFYLILPYTLIQDLLLLIELEIDDSGRWGSHWASAICLSAPLVLIITPQAQLLYRR